MFSDFIIVESGDLPEDCKFGETTVQSTLLNFDAHLISLSDGDSFVTIDLVISELEKLKDSFEPVQGFTNKEQLKSHFIDLLVKKICSTNIENELLGGLFKSWYSLIRSDLHLCPSRHVLPVISRLHYLSQRVPLYVKPFLLDSIDQFEAQEVIDRKNRRPFIDFLICASTSDTEVVPCVRRTISTLIQRGGEASNYFWRKFSLYTYGLLVSAAEISPIVFEESKMQKVIKYLTGTLQESTENQAEVSRLTKERLIPRILRLDTYRKLKTLTLYLKFVRCNALICVLLDHILKDRDFFINDIDKYQKFYAFDLILFLHTLYTKRSRAIQIAFFYIQDVDRTDMILSFPTFSDLPSSRRELLSEFQKVNETLPSESRHIRSLLPFILQIFQQLWSLPIDIAEELCQLLLTIAATNTHWTNVYSFNPGRYVYFAVMSLLETMESAPSKHRDVFRQFGADMKSILEKNIQNL